MTRNGVTRTSSNKRGPSFKSDEIESMLEFVNEHLPIGPADWSKVQLAHLERWPKKERFAQSLKRKFQELYNKKIPTGDPHCPPNVRLAKQIFRLIEERTDSSAQVADTDLGIEDSDDEEEDIADDNADEEDDQVNQDPVSNATTAHNDETEDHGDVEVNSSVPA